MVSIIIISQLNFSEFISIIKLFPRRKSLCSNISITVIDMVSIIIILSIKLFRVHFYNKIIFQEKIFVLKYLHNHYRYGLDNYNLSIKLFRVHFYNKIISQEKIFVLKYLHNRYRYGLDNYNSLN